MSGWTVVKESAISAETRRVFNALTSRRQLNVWFTQEAKVDLRVGGRYSNKDGDRGRFLEVVPNEKLRFTWENPVSYPGSVVEILLKRIRRKTILTLIHSGFKRRRDFEDYASRRSGWNWALDNLKAHLEGRRIRSYEGWLKKNKGKLLTSTSR